MDVKLLTKRRRNIRLSGFSIGVLVGMGLAYFVTPADSASPIADYLFYAILIGIIFGAVGFVIAEILRWFIPNQRALGRIEKSMRTKKDIMRDLISIIAFLAALLITFIQYCSMTS